MLAKTQKRISRHKKVRARISGTAARPRLAVFKSNTCIYAQLINDVDGVTLASSSDIKLTSGSKTERARLVGTSIAEVGKAAGVSSVVFDRGGFAYAGRVQALADAAREAGLQF